MGIHRGPGRHGAGAHIRAAVSPQVEHAPGRHGGRNSHLAGGGSGSRTGDSKAGVDGHRGPRLHRVSPGKPQASIRSMERVVLASIIIVMLIVTLMIALVSESIIRPIRYLTGAAQQLSARVGDTFRPLRVHSHDEIGTLTGTFNSMAAQVFEQHELLEARVRERTEALSLTNVGLAAEIAEREQAQIALRESSELNRLLLEGAPEAIYGVDIDGKTTFCNAACMRLLGYET